jgi:hypothetical protein
MTRRDFGYRPTSFSMRSITSVPMMTRGVSGTPPDDSSAPGDAPAIPDLEVFVAELSMTEEVLHSIQKLPATVAELRLPSTVDCLTVHELQSVLHALKIPVATIDFLKNGRDKSKRDRASQKKATMLNLLAAKFGEQWGVVHEMLSQKKTSNNSRRKKPAHDVPASGYNAEKLDLIYRPLDAVLNETLSSLYRSGALPTRDSLIFLSDAEYESVKQFHLAMHPRDPEASEFTDGCDTAALEYLIGTLRETTVALETYYELASTAKLYVEKLVKHHEERGHAYGEGKIFLSQGEQESSEDPGELGND